MAKPLPIADYDPSRVIQTIGNITPTAYGPDARISVGQSTDGYTIQQGQDGHVIRVKQRGIVYPLSFSLMKSDPANDLLTELYQKDYDGSTGSGIVKYELADNNGNARCSAAYCWINRLPELTYSASGAEVYQWMCTLVSADLQTRALKFLT
jgi:hypothetical protein